MPSGKPKPPPSPFPSSFDGTKLQFALADTDEQQVDYLRSMFGHVLGATSYAEKILGELDDFVEDGETYRASTPQRRTLALQTLDLTRHFASMLGASELQAAAQAVQQIFAEAEPGLPDRELASTAVQRLWAEVTAIQNEIKTIEGRERRYANARFRERQQGENALLADAYRIHEAEQLLLATGYVQNPDGKTWSPARG